MELSIKKQENNKYCIIGTFEIGNSEEYTTRVLVNNISYKKARELKDKYGE